MSFKNLIQIFILISLNLIVYGLTQSQSRTVSSTTKQTGPISYGCVNCLQSKSMTCIDGNCYCQTNHYWNQSTQQCQFMYCFNNTICQVPEDPMRICSNSYCICQVPYVEDPTNGNKCSQTTIPTHPTTIGPQPQHTTAIPSAATPSTTIQTTVTPEQTTNNQDPFVVHNDCSNCFYLNNLVCIDQKCYCAPNYQWNPNNKNCLYIRCNSDDDCYQSEDPMRYCNNGGKCMCLPNYEEDRNNGLKCTFHLNVWYWVWIFILLPVIGLGVGIWFCIRKNRRAVQAQLITIPEDQPPSYGSQFDPNQNPKRIHT